MIPNFDFSVVTAVYNAEHYLNDTVQSLLKQDYGFSKIQLILVDDGSTDNSPAMCDSFQEMYPENIFVVHKKNGGVSSARNEGLKLVRGKYVSFLDSDDMLSKNAMTEVYRFFEAYSDTDVVSLPTRFFDARKGDHVLNYKFERGTRLINLEEEPQNLQLAVTSAFVRADAIQDNLFDVRLKYAEDAKFLQMILLEKRTLGVVAEASHFYRIRTQGEASAIQKAERVPEWYYPSLMYFWGELLDLCETRYGSVPRFIQYTIAYDMQWRLRRGHLPSTVFSEQEKNDYREQFFTIVRRIDDDIIANQITVPSFLKLYELYQKHGELPKSSHSEDENLFHYSDRAPFHLDPDHLSCDFFTIKDKTAIIECSIPVMTFVQTQLPEIVAEAYEEQFRCKPFLRNKEIYSMSLPVAKYVEYVFRIPLKDLNTPLQIRFFRQTNNNLVPIKELLFNRFSPLTEKYRHAYADIAGGTLTYSNGELLYKKHREPRIVREVCYLWELFKTKHRVELHAVAGRLFYSLCKPFIKKPIWIISDRTEEAGDNGEALFRYLSSLNLRDVSLWFAVSDKCSSFQEIKRIGHVIKAKSYQHKLLYLLCQFNISSHADSDVVSLFSGYNDPYRDIESRIRFVFLQHGVTHNNLSDWLNRYNSHFSGIVAVANPEVEAFRTYPYYYPDDAIWLTGFPRYDRLYHDEKQYITIMPTWRKELLLDADRQTGIRQVRPGFENSKYFQFYERMLNDRRLKEAADKYGYTVRFLPHPTLHPHIGLFKNNGSVELLSPDTPYRQVFAESSLVLTDYSSIAFDFAYLRKPIVYAQFDRDEIFSGEHVYTHGYFDYERDGFGEVETEYEKTIDRLIEYMKNGCKLKDKYRDRIEAFFAFNDCDNCRRVYAKIRELQAK